MNQNKLLAGANTVEQLLKIAATLVPLATTVMKQAKPLATDMGAGAAKAGTAVKKGAKHVGGVAADALDGIGDTKNGLLDGLVKIKDKKQLKKAIKEARQAVLEHATTRVAVSELSKAKQTAVTNGMGPIAHMPGCFVIATYKKFDFDKDLTDYTGVYVGRAADAAEGVALAISRDGDPDVYADVKHAQNVYVYVYNCLPEEVDERFINLVQTFEGEEMYGAQTSTS